MSTLGAMFIQDFAAKVDAVRRYRAREQEGAARVALQEAINEHAAHSWKLLSVAADPTSQGVFMVWDTTGFFSG